MINLADGKKMIVAQFRKEFGGMNMSEDTALEFLNRVARTAYGSHITTTKERIVSAYNAQKIEFLGV